MLKLTWLGAILLTVVVCSTSVSHAQKIRYEYAGPLDRLQTLPLRDIITAEPVQRVARLEPVKKLRPYHSGVSNAVVGRITRGVTFSPANQTPEWTSRQVFSTPPSPQVIGEALSLEVPAPTFAGPLTDTTNFPVETDYQPGQDPPNQPSYYGPLTESTDYPTETGYLPGQEDPTRFGYRDGKSFGFENNRLFNPLDGPQLNLQGAPTANLGTPGCDDWENFCRGRELELETACGGLKAKPGHLGIPWLGSKDPCDQTVPLLKKRGHGCKKCQAEESCASCGACPTCGK